MSEKNQNSLIGYDPLAWLNQDVESEPESATGADSDWHTENIESQDQSEIQAEEAETDAIGWQEPSVEQIDALGSETAETIVLDSVLNIQKVGQLYERFLAALEHNNKIEIDASAVTVVDTASLQLLLILKRTAIKVQKQVVIDFPSDKFIEAAELLGLSEMLDVDQAVAGFF